jgi:ABC-type transporter Mla maintaining outer membrane lipid asymmetry ATPase subunit MlaF
MILRDGSIIFDGTSHDLAHITDPYIKEYIS